MATTFTYTAPLIAPTNLTVTRVPGGGTFVAGHYKFCVQVGNAAFTSKQVAASPISDYYEIDVVDGDSLIFDFTNNDGTATDYVISYEKFLSTSAFREEKVNPLPPALIFKLSDFAREIVKKLEKEGFILGINLIEVFPTLIRKICKEEVCLRNSLTKTATKNQESALLCAQIALLHSQFKTRWLGYKDGFLFLPEMSFWKKDWQEKFYRAWKNRPRLRYHRLTANLFN